jgi:hypothetical protein
MARFESSGLDDLISEMQRMGQQTGPVAEEMVQAAVDIIKEKWKESALEHGHIDTGEMFDSIGYGLPVHAANIIYQDVYPQGKDSKGVGNAEKAFILHYGSSRIPASYWVDDAMIKADPEVEKACIAIWDRFLNGGG